MSLKYFVGNCRDFEEEETLLQAMGRKHGVTIDQTPKYHCKLVGKGLNIHGGVPKLHIARSL